MPNPEQNINRVLRRIQKTADLAGKNAAGITLLAVSKGQSASAVRTAWRAGLNEFGENYLQEALAKMAELQDLPLTWHFIGPLQSNKTRGVAEHFSWVHSIDRLSIAERLSQQRPASAPPLNVCLQVNIDGESGKSGVAPAEALDLARAVVKLPGLKLRGLMAIPAPREHRGEQRLAFDRLARLADELRESAPSLASMDTLSMGMSGDLEAAIEAGSTMVRVGTGIFGPRPGFTAEKASGEGIDG